MTKRQGYIATGTNKKLIYMSKPITTISHTTEVLESKQRNAAIKERLIHRLRKRKKSKSQLPSLHLHTAESESDGTYE